VFSISRWKGTGRRWRERWPSKIDSNWGKHCCFPDLVKNGCRIVSRMIAESLNIAKTVVILILKDYLGKGNLCASFAPWHLSKGKIESGFAKILSLWPMQANVFLANLLREMGPGVLPMTPKQSDRFLNGLVRNLLGRRNWNSKGPAKEHADNFFSTLKA